ncbi:hypothetical protein I6J18_02360 [Peribacillus psychrosaccharolyticus]|uniref:Tissue inhibitor of metalloproteinase n=1 Tax=Peribacillus psychrosaccharolyticus TaxID=1407 RepID=A0A974S1Y8_PERPY|nr:hypothetical protein [Peribacillus psychrosaccharolyticus]MEC2056001.1 hypothetical protein [Peribacillus psychrosaccharolyticus]MED3743177.1 hypothetical protein [Peribacillus psychrosaccharolyticus]QQT00790.1 hypothetical protein I6J18_02360 [Peribacillus psychrosaccharolyticus]
MNIQKLAFVILLFISFTICSFPSTSYACKCVEPKSPTKELRESTAVFSGKVIDQLEKGRTQFVLFEVKETWKGLNESQAIVETVNSSSSCGYEFEDGKEYIVYTNETDGHLEVSLCSRTHLLSAASEDLDKLGKGEEPSEQVTLDLSDEDEPPVWMMLSLLVVGFGLAVFYGIKRVKKKVNK